MKHCLGKISFKYNCSMINKLIIGLLIIASACTSINQAAPINEDSNIPTATNTPSISSEATLISSPTLTPTEALKATIAVITATSIPELTSEPWVFYEQGQPIEAPILLYHRIIESEIFSRYSVSPSDFYEQMQSLQDWGYTVIPLSVLVDVIQNGGELPVRPIVITFDDGHLDVFENAFPIMQEFGMVGINYVVANRINSPNFMGKEVLLNLTTAGWEIGAHSYSHIDLTLNHNVSGTEVGQARKDISANFNVDIDSFAYPFGKFDEYTGDKVFSSGYASGVGLGKSWKHTKYTRFYLSRIEIFGGWTIDQFAEVLPWSSSIISP
jgi:peptidoglycan/xylan/chitin deacetylase (PgdA/CDA1 family)